MDAKHFSTVDDVCCVRFHFIFDIFTSVVFSFVRFFLPFVRTVHSNFGLQICGRTSIALFNIETFPHSAINYYQLLLTSIGILFIDTDVFFLFHSLVACLLPHTHISKQIQTNYQPLKPTFHSCNYSHR